MSDFIINNNILEEYTGNAETVIIPNGVTEIGRNAFSECKSLKKVIIPDSVIKIGWDAFEGCTALTEVSMPKYLEIIDSGAFNGCTSLKTYKFRIV